MSPIVVATVIASAAENTKKLDGLIIGRSGPTMIVRTTESPNLLVMLTDMTTVAQLQGVLKPRKKEMSMAALIPGLAVRIEGVYSSPNEIIAKSISFKGNDLQRAESIQAGLLETNANTEHNKEALAKQRDALQIQKEALLQQQESLAKQQEHIGRQQEQLTGQQHKISANKAAIGAAIKRFGQLDDYYILDELGIYFGNGQVTVTSQEQAGLRQLAARAKVIDSYMIQIIGYASSAGSATLNQKLSEDRADNVAKFLVPQCDIPLANVLAPDAMGESRQVGNDTTAEGQRQNRRVVVRVSQNKGIAGP